MIRRPVEQSAPETLLEIIAELSKLAHEQPTTVEIEVALWSTIPAAQVLLREWISSRHLNQAQAMRAAEFRERHAKVASFVERIAPLRTSTHDLASPFVQRRRA